MTEHDDKDMLAAEYVLGTPDPAERNSVAARRLREADLDAAITAFCGFQPSNIDECRAWHDVLPICA